jgi:glucosylceramidase
VHFVTYTYEEITVAAITEWIISTEAQPWQKQGDPVARHYDGQADLEVTDQTGVTWRGFGGTFNELGWLSLQHLSQDEQDTAMDRLFARDGEMLFDFCRMPIGANDYAASWYSHCEKPGDIDLNSFSIERDHDMLIPYIREALKRHPDLELFASPWSPPSWMKQPAVYNNGVVRPDPSIRQAYANYFLKFVEAYQEEGINIAQVHLQNEWNANQKFPSCVMDGATLADLIGRYLGPTFAAAGSDTEVWLGTYNGPICDCGGHEQTTGFNDLIFQVMQDEEARKYIRGLGYQWYAKMVLQRTRQSWPDLPIIQT